MTPPLLDLLAAFPQRCRDARIRALDPRVSGAESYRKAFLKRVEDLVDQIRREIPMRVSTTGDLILRTAAARVVRAVTSAESGGNSDPEETCMRIAQHVANEVIPLTKVPR